MGFTGARLRKGLPPHRGLSSRAAPGSASGYEAPRQDIQVIEVPAPGYTGYRGSVSGYTGYGGSALGYTGCGSSVSGNTGYRGSALGHTAAEPKGKTLNYFRRILVCWVIHDSG